MKKMLKHIGIPIAIASIAAIVALAWTMILSPAQAVAQSAQEAYITVEISTGDDSVSWSDPNSCSSGYNIYLAVTSGAGVGTNHPHTYRLCSFGQYPGNSCDLP